MHIHFLSVIDYIFASTSLPSPLPGFQSMMVPSGSCTHGSVKAARNGERVSLSALKLRKMSVTSAMVSVRFPSEKVRVVTICCFAPVAIPTIHRLAVSLLSLRTKDNITEAVFRSLRPFAGR